MDNSLTKGQIVAICFIACTLLLFLLVFFKINHKTKNDEIILNENIKATDAKIIVNGNFVEFVSAGDEYTEKGANSSNGKDITISYYRDNRQVSEIDTTILATYIVKYQTLYKNKLLEATKVVIINDTKSPKLIVPDKITIKSSEALNYNIYEGVSASDNSSNVKVTCTGNLQSKPGNYIITCKAIDSSSNETTKKRLIKVIPD